MQVGSAGGSVTVINHHYHGAAAPPLRRDGVQRAAVRRVLALMSGLDNRVAVLDFAEEQLGSRLLKELPVYKINRLERYVQAVLRNQGSTRREK